MHEYTISKIRIFGSDAKKWQEQILTVIDKDQLPVHFGGTMVDENGDPRCSTLVSMVYILLDNYESRIPVQCMRVPYVPPKHLRLCPGWIFLFTQIFVSDLRVYPYRSPYRTSES